MDRALAFVFSFTSGLIVFGFLSGIPIVLPVKIPTIDEAPVVRLDHLLVRDCSLGIGRTP